MKESLTHFIKSSPLMAAIACLILVTALYVLAMTIFDIAEVTYLRAENEAIRKNCPSETVAK